MAGCVAWALALTALATANAAHNDRKEFYNRNVFPPTWHLVGRASQFQRMYLLVAVKQQNLETLEKQFWAIADPKSPAWRNFLTRAEVDSIVHSSSGDMKTVTSWLTTVLDNRSLHVTSDAVEVRASVGDVERLFEAELYNFVHDNGHTVTRAMGPHSVPRAVGAVIDFVEGIADFPMHRTSVRKVPHQPRSNSSSTVALVAPETLLQMYSVPAVAEDSQVSQGPAEFQADTSYNKEDLKTFFKQTDIAAERVVHTVGPYDGAQPDTEATLDVQYIMSVGQKQTDWYWTANNWMYQWSHNFFNAESIPDAVSISWGWAEDQQCASGISQPECQTLGIDSQQYVTRVNTEFQKIGLRGVSLFVASGDSGANGRSDSLCTGTKLHASFPAASPYVTAVGATMLQSPKFDLKNPPPACSAMGSGYACASGGVEVAVSAAQAGFTSGGGFSDYVQRPSYQQQAVDGYLTSMAKELPPPTYFNASNRAIPDIAAMGNNFLIYMESFGGWSPVGGTSAATPTVAGVAAHLNDLAYRKTGKPLGFLNSLLYQMNSEAPEAFTDVTVGDNRCTEDGCFASCKGYEAAKGWDPVTGLGTPVTDKMLDYVGKVLDAQAKRQLVV